jgi:hypothetical protein
LQVFVQFVHIVEQQVSLPEAVMQLLESVLHVHVHSQDGSVHAVQHEVDVEFAVVDEHVGVADVHVYLHAEEHSSQQEVVVAEAEVLEQGLVVTVNANPV